ncbi:MAG: hypothetical protein K2L83_07535 [Muribaculaceae bacterium]|nr:hypothetical protein [Muribaculaceae bacterium]
MTSVIRHIEYLTRRHDCVILPGIGAIVAEYTPARIDAERGVILPPTRRFGLNPAIRHDDGMLADSISRAERVKFEEGRSIMAQEMDGIIRALRRDREFTLGKIGRLSLDDADRMEFIPRTSPDANSEGMGAPAASLRRPGAAIATSSESDSDLPADCYTRILSKKNYYIAINKIFARCAASLIVIIAFALPFIMPQSNTATPEVSASMNPVETLSRRIPARIESTEPAEPALPEEAPAAETAATETAVDGMYLIVATFHSADEAATFIAARRGGAYELRIVESRGIHRVYAGHGDSQTLRALLNSTEFRAAFPEGWIWDSAK